MRRSEHHWKRRWSSKMESSKRPREVADCQSRASNVADPVQYRDHVPVDRLPLVSAQASGFIQGYLPPWRTSVTGVRLFVILNSRKESPQIVMKAGIHPAYNEINVICACGHTFKTRSTHK